MSIELNSLKMTMALSPQHILDLVETVGQAVLINPQLSANDRARIVVAGTMMSLAHKVLEDCGVDIKLSIGNKRWHHRIEYITPQNPGGDIGPCDIIELLE